MRNSDTYRIQIYKEIASSNRSRASLLVSTREHSQVLSQRALKCVQKAHKCRITKKKNMSARKHSRALTNVEQKSIQKCVQKL